MTCDGCRKKREAMAGNSTYAQAGMAALRGNFMAGRPSPPPRSMAGAMGNSMQAGMAAGNPPLAAFPGAGTYNPPPVHSPPPSALYFCDPSSQFHGMSVGQILGLASRSMSGMQTGYRTEDLHEACSRIHGSLARSARQQPRPPGRAYEFLSQSPCRQ